MVNADELPESFIAIRISSLDIAAETRDRDIIQDGLMILLCSFGMLIGIHHFRLLSTL